MSLMLEMEPEAETRLRESAAAEGVTPGEFVARLLRGYQPPPQTEPEWKTRLRASQEYARQAFLDSGQTDEELGEEIDAKIKTYRAERATGECES